MFGILFLSAPARKATSILSHSSTRPRNCLQRGVFENLDKSNRTLASLNDNSRKSKCYHLVADKRFCWFFMLTEHVSAVGNSPIIAQIARDNVKYLEVIICNWTDDRMCKMMVLIPMCLWLNWVNQLRNQNHIISLRFTAKQFPTLRNENLWATE